MVYGEGVENPGLLDGVQVTDDALKLNELKLIALAVLLIVSV